MKNASNQSASLFQCFQTDQPQTKENQDFIMINRKEDYLVEQTKQKII